MSRENAAAKARRLLVEARVRILSANEDNGHVSAEVRGDTARVYAVDYEAGEGGWSCTCPARGACAHLQAVQLIFVVAPRSADG